MDSSFVIPRLITEIILPGISSYFASKKYSVSYSQIIPTVSAEICYSLIIGRLRENVVLGINISGADENEKRKIAGAFKASVADTPFVLQLISGREILSAALTTVENGSVEETFRYEYSIALRDKESEVLLKFYIPGRFFNILIPSLDTTVTYDNISEQLIPFFRKPGLLYPSIEMIFEKLSVREIAELLDFLKRNNHLTDYQLVLLVNGFPERSLKIKEALSKNRQESLKDELKKYKGRVTKEDISCGVYSVEESIGHLLKLNRPAFAKNIGIISTLIRKISDYELYSRKSWDDWVAEMEERDQLYNALTMSSDSVIKKAFPGFTEGKFQYLTKMFSGARLRDIFSEEYPGYNSTTADSRIKIIKNYRSLRTERSRFSHESFALLLASVQRDRDFERIVRETGWFVLSTALKQCQKKIQERVTSCINHPAAMLIRGVISGTINPDIIHDEMQVNRARGDAVKSIIELYNDGLIELDI